MDAKAKPDLYEIRIQGVLSDRLLQAFPGLEVKPRGAETLLAGALPDQAALYGVLSQIEALGLKLLEVRTPPRKSADPGEPEDPSGVSGATPATP